MNRNGKKAFTLVELLVTVGIMGMLGTMAVSGYYAASRGMADRGALTDAASLVRVARQRSFSDHVPCAVIFMNRLLRAGTSDKVAIVQGRAIAVRMGGRITRKEGSFIYDEFADFEKTYPVGNASKAVSKNLYKIDSGGVKRSTVKGALVAQEGISAKMMFAGSYTNITLYALEVSGGNKDWKTGDAYAYEIASMTLPHGYFFGTTVPTTVGVDQIVSSSQFVFSPTDASLTLPSMPVSAIDTSGNRRAVGNTGEGDNVNNSGN